MSQIKKKQALVLVGLVTAFLASLTLTIGQMRGIRAEPGNAVVKAASPAAAAPGPPAAASVAAAAAGVGGTPPAPPGPGPAPVPLAGLGSAHTRSPGPRRDPFSDAALPRPEAFTPPGQNPRPLGGAPRPWAGLPAPPPRTGVPPFPVRQAAATAPPAPSPLPPLASMAAAGAPGADRPPAFNGHPALHRPLGGASDGKRPFDPAEASDEAGWVRTWKLTALVGAGAHRTAVIENTEHGPVSVREGDFINTLRVAAVKDREVVFANARGVWTLPLFTAPEVSSEASAPSEENPDASP